MAKTLREKACLLIGAMFISACTATADGSGSSGEPAKFTVPLKLLQGFSHCPQRSEGEHVAVFTDAAQWKRHLGTLGSNLEKVQATLPKDTNWQKESVVLVGIGQRRSAGFGLELLSPVQVQAGELRLQMQVREPAPGSLQAMVLTQPCSYYLVATQTFERVSLNGVMVKR